MRKISLILGFLLLLPCVGITAEDPAPKTVMVFPFKRTAADGKVTYDGAVPMVLVSLLREEGDLRFPTSRPFEAAVKGKQVSLARMTRILNRNELDAAIWGQIEELPSGYALSVSVLMSGARKPQVYDATGRDMQQLVTSMEEVAVLIGNDVFDRPKIGDIELEGNVRVPRQTIMSKLDLKPGTPFRRSALGEAVRKIFEIGKFEDVKIKAEDTGNGEVDLRIVLTERPSINEIDIAGNTVFTKDEILDVITTKSHKVISQRKIRRDIEKLKGMYEKEGYYDPKIEYEVNELSENQADLVFKIDEGQKSYLDEIRFAGAKELDPSELKKILTFKEKSWIWFLDDSGKFTTDQLEENRARLFQYYLMKGFVRVQVGAPEMEIKDGDVILTFPVNEGDRYQVRKVDLQGDLIMPEDKMQESLKTKTKTWYDRGKIQEDLESLTKLYNNMGYAYANVEPRQRINDEYNFVDVVYDVRKGQSVSIGRVDIRGNQRTRDKVIRRMLAINEGDRYSSAAMEATKNNLERMDYFETVQLKTAPGRQPDVMDIEVNVMEKKTGSLAAGLGFSSQDGAMGNVNLSERNLWGLGIVANLKGSISGRRNTYQGSLTYPWLFDFPVSGTIELHKTMGKEGGFVREDEGFGAYLRFPIFGQWYGSTGFKRTSSSDKALTMGSMRSLRDYYAQYNTVPERFLSTARNTVILGVSRDTRNSSMIPTGGSVVSLQSRLTGFGGDVAFSRHFAEASYYRPLVWKFIMKAKANFSALLESGNEPIPFNDRIMLGGISTIRGYRPSEIGPRDKYGAILGGDRALYGTVECLFPLVPQLNLNGVTFFDAGGAWNAAASQVPTDIKAGAGVGIRWLSPMGPMRIEYGWKLQPEVGEEAGAVAFAMGQLF